MAVSDAVGGDPPGRCKLVPEKVEDDPARLRESVKSLFTLNLNILFPGYSEPILQGTEDPLKELVDSFRHALFSFSKINH